jgi:hypothetical protein
MQLIYVDQFIFDLLPDELDPVPLSGSGIRFGLNIAPLRNLYLEDFHNLSNPGAWRALFQKSILSAVRADIKPEGDTMRIDIGLQFAIYRLPPAKNAGPVILLGKSSAWLQQNEELLKQSPVLRPLLQFAAVTAVLRTALEAGTKNNFTELLEVAVPESPTPRLLCRPEGRGPCGLHTLQTNLNR